MESNEKGSEISTTKSDIVLVSPSDASIARLVVENPSITDQEIAVKVGLCRQSVNRKRNSKEFRNAIRDILRISESEIRRVAVKSMMRLEQLLDHEDPKIQLMASTALLKLCDGRIGSFPMETLKI